MYSYSFLKWLVPVVIAFGVFATIGYGLFEHSNVKTVTFTVKDKQAMVKCDNGNCHSHYLIYTDKGVYKDTDSIWFFKFRSSDLYGQLERGHRYICKVYGFRIGFTSSYPNIISCKGTS